MAEFAKKQVGRDLTSGPIMSSLLMFALPVVCTDLIQQLYSMVDLIIIGHFAGNVGTVGVNSGGEIADFLMPVATSFAAAGQIYIAQLAGAKKFEEQKRAIGTLITLMLAVSTAFMVLTIAATNPILRLLNCPGDAIRQAQAYMIITAVGLPFIYGYNAVCGVLRGMGESKRPLIFIIIAAAVNIFLDILLVAAFNLGAAGTAIATVFSQITSFTTSFLYLYRHKETFAFELKPSYFKCDEHHAAVLLRLGVPQALRSVLVRASMLWVNSSVNACGDIASGTNGIGNKLQKFLEIFNASMAQASAAMVGQNLGGKQQDRAQKAVLCTLLCSLSFAAVISTVVLIFPRQVFGVFTPDESVQTLGVNYIQILAVHILVSAVTSSFQSMVIGSGNAVLNFVIGILDGVVCKVGLSLVFVYVVFQVTPETDWYMTTLGYFWGTGLSRVLPAFVCMAYFFSGRWKRRSLVSN